MSTSKATPRTSKSSEPHALLVVGTYHGVMAGLTYKQQKFFMKFSVKRHVGSINDLGITDRYVASCGVDERVFLFTNKAEVHRSSGSSSARLADLGSVAPPAEVMCLRFAGHRAAQEGAKGRSGPPSTYLLCGCSDGRLLIYRTRDWSVQTALAVHERAVAGVAVHPGSQGLLAVTVGQDRSVAVLDLAKGKLLTKWKYNSRRALAGAAPEAEAEAEAAAREGKAGEEPEEEPPVKRVKVDPVTRSLFAKEEPVGVLFSPAGTRLAVYSHISCIIYNAATMEAEDGFVMERPQPSQEMGCALFVTEDRLLFGNEAGELSTFVVRPKVLPAVAPAPLPTTLPLSYPSEVRERAEQLLATPLNVALETRQKNPLRHTSRIKALGLHTNARGAAADAPVTVFSMDANGVVLALQFDPKESERLVYLTSGNCRGRVTCMNVLTL